MKMAEFFELRAIIFLLALILLAFFISVKAKWPVQANKLILAETVVSALIIVFAYHYLYNNDFRSTVKPEPYFAINNIQTHLPLPPNSVHLFNPTGKGWVYYSKLNMQESKVFFAALKNNPNLSNFHFDETKNTFLVSDGMWRLEINLIGDQDNRRFYIGVVQNPNGG